MKTLRILLAGVCLALAGQAWALIETYDFSSPQLEARYQQLSEELRCPKCQNQNIADSNAPIAQDLRKLLHQQLEAGASDDEILDYMSDRYGEFVRYRPRFGGTTVFLWLAPLLLLLAAIGVLLISLRSRADTGAADGSVLTEQEQARIQRLLDKTEQDS
ncbi:Cytochrome c-type biogenesis protein CcmH [Halioglobus japonicus]|nr:Cytochrome c-type biogenesis protein CcmH [Halioglobus japonicus]